MLRLVVLAVAGLSSAQAQLNEGAPLPANHPAIAYDTAPVADRIAELQHRMDQGTAKLTFEERTGYLRSLLDWLQIPIESQIAVFSKTSLQQWLIDPLNPRTIFFDDSVAVAWMRGGFIEVAAQDPQQGAIFYVLQQTPAERPQLQRDARCLTCHFSHDALGVAGFLVRSIPTASDGKTLPWLGNFISNHNSPIEERWGGWYVTGQFGSTRHLGNRLLADGKADPLSTAAPVLQNLRDRFDTTAYLADSSDVTALLVFEHQMHMMNILTRIGWEARVAMHEGRPLSSLERSIDDAVDYLLFVDEAPLPGVRGKSPFAEKFTARGPFDKQGRSLRQLQLDRRLFKYPCSYMIYAPAFDQLPEQARSAMYRRMWKVLSGAAPEAKYKRLAHADRRAVVEILHDTKPGLPDAFQARAVK
jgi:hypothetical protein